MPYLNYTLFYCALELIILASIALSTGEHYKTFGGVVSTGMLIAWLPVPISLSMST